MKIITFLMIVGFLLKVIFASAATSAGISFNYSLAEIFPLVPAPHKPVKDKLNRKNLFIGDVNTKWLKDGRRMQLLSDLTFIDENSNLWYVPERWVIDGASIPAVFWTSIGSPFVGKYRNASIVHDYYCDVKTTTWKATHRMFYSASIASGVNQIKAKLMYSAVYLGGPRWEEPAKIYYGISKVNSNSNDHDNFGENRTHQKMFALLNDSIYINKAGPYVDRKILSFDLISMIKNVTSAGISQSGQHLGGQNDVTVSITPIGDLESLRNENYNIQQSIPYTYSEMNDLESFIETTNPSIEDLEATLDQLRVIGLLEKKIYLHEPLQ